MNVSPEGSELRKCVRCSWWRWPRRADTENQAEDFTDIAYLQRETGLSREADQSLNELLAAVHRIEDLNEKVSGLCEVALARSGVPKNEWVAAKSVPESDKDRARPVYREAIAVAANIKNKTKRERAYCEIIRSQHHAGLLAEAVEVARRIEDPDSRTRQITEIVEFHANGDEVRPVLAEALAAARAIPDVFWRDCSADRVVRTAAQAGLFTEALALARKSAIAVGRPTRFAGLLRSNAGRGRSKTRTAHSPKPLRRPEGSLIRGKEPTRYVKSPPRWRIRNKVGKW